MSSEATADFLQSTSYMNCPCRWHLAVRIEMTSPPFDLWLHPYYYRQVGNCIVASDLSNIWKESCLERTFLGLNLQVEVLKSCGRTRLPYNCQEYQGACSILISRLVESQCWQQSSEKITTEREREMLGECSARGAAARWLHRWHGGLNWQLQWRMQRCNNLRICRCKESSLADRWQADSTNRTRGSTEDRCNVLCNKRQCTVQ